MTKNNAEEPICIIAGADAAFALPLTVTLHSALRRLDPRREVEIVVADGGLGDDNRARIETTLGQAHPRLTLRFAAPRMERVSGLNSALYSSSAYLRIMIPEFLPSERKRALYLDSDILVTADLATLWDVDMGAFPLWAVQNYSLGDFERQVRAPFPELAAPEDGVYFNSGMLLFNLPAWRDENISERTFKFLDQHSHRLSFPDQDALNAILAGHWGRLDPRWNMQMSNLGVVPSLEAPTLGPADPSAIRSLSGICHFTVKKPWRPDYTGRLGGAWAAEAVRTGWMSLYGAAALLARQSVTRNRARVRRRLGI